MRRFWLAALVGAIFGAGLLLSGMTQPAKVIGFLDVGGHWDASLAFVMMGAIAVHALAYRAIVRRPRPLLDRRFHLPAKARIDARLLGGAALFGVGWGLAGYCPGPALVAAGALATPALVFVATMALGMALARLINPSRDR